MADFKQKLMNWLTSKTSRTVEMPGGAAQSIIQRNKIGPVVSALKAPQAPTAQPTTTPLATKMPERTFAQPTPPPTIQPPVQPAPPLATTMQGTAFTQPNILPVWSPKMEALLPDVKEDRKKLIDAIIQKESSGAAAAEFTPKGKATSKGQMQIEEDTWKEISKWRKAKEQRVYDYDKNWMNSVVNRMYGTQYLFEVIPDILKKNNAPVNIKNILGSYNVGPTAFKKGDYDVNKFPQVLDYITKIQKFYE